MISQFFTISRFEPRNNITIFNSFIFSLAKIVWFKLSYPNTRKQIYESVCRNTVKLCSSLRWWLLAICCRVFRWELSRTLSFEPTIILVQESAHLSKIKTQMILEPRATIREILKVKLWMHFKIIKFHRKWSLIN